MRFIQETKSSKEQKRQLLNDAAIGELSMAVAQMITRGNDNNFIKDSELVKTWTRLVQSGQYKKDEVPEIGNLREIVYDTLSTSQK